MFYIVYKIEGKCQGLLFFGSNPLILIIDKSELPKQILIEFTKFSFVLMKYCQNI